MYKATQNDARILRSIMKTDFHLVNLLKEGDVVILDRGFRDAVIELENGYKLKVMMPNFLEKGQKQFTTNQANESRLVTKIRQAKYLYYKLIS